MRKVRNFTRTLLLFFGVCIIPEKDWKECMQCYAIGSCDIESIEWLLGVPRHLFPLAWWEYEREYEKEFELYYKKMCKLYE